MTIDKSGNVYATGNLSGSDIPAVSKYDTDGNKIWTWSAPDTEAGSVFFAIAVDQSEQIINKLREAEILLNQGDTIAIVSKKIGVSEYTYYRWRKEYGGMRVDQAHRLKELEQENSRLKRLVADLSLDNTILKEAARGNF